LTKGEDYIVYLIPVAFLPSCAVLCCAARIIGNYQRLEEPFE
jgi:hypothetical protein